MKLLDPSLRQKNLKSNLVIEDSKSDDNMVEQDVEVEREFLVPKETKEGQRLDKNGVEIHIEELHKNLF